MLKRLDLDHRQQIPTVVAKHTVEQQQVTIVSRETKGDIHSAESHRADIVREALRLMPATLENERRSNDIAAGMIITGLGSWFESRVVKSGVFTSLTYMLLFALGVALAGILLVAALGNGIIPVEQLLVPLVVIAGISVFILGVAFALMLWSKHEWTELLVDASPVHEILVPVEAVNGQVLVPVKQVDPYMQDLYADRRKTDALAIHRQTRTEISDETIVQ